MCAEGLCGLCICRDKSLSQGLFCTDEPALWALPPFVCVALCAGLRTLGPSLSLGVGLGLWLHRALHQGQGCTCLSLYRYQCACVTRCMSVGSCVYMYQCVVCTSVSVYACKCVSLSVFTGRCTHMSMGASHAPLTSAFLGLYSAHPAQIWAERGGQHPDVPCVCAGLDLTPSLPPGSHACPAGALPQLMPQSGHPSQEGLWAPFHPLMAHEPEPKASELLDLSFLTEEEQEAIAEVLSRDAHLRQLEEGRVR